MLKKPLNRLDILLTFVEDWTLFLAVAVALVVAMTNIVLRKISPVSLYWSDEVVRKVIFLSTFIGCSAAIRSRSLIRIDALPQMLPALKKPLAYLHHLGVLVFGFLVIRLGWRLMMQVQGDSFARTATLQIPEWYFYAAFPLVGGLMILRTLLVMVQDWRATGGKPKDR
ncbi:MAG: TRAP transporter small permease [Deltaproteobacteria bacterium]|nr:TRAP transporter small permease [Deltaproteobacteria bacterium]